MDHITKNFPKNRDRKYNHFNHFETMRQDRGHEYFGGRRSGRGRGHGLRHDYKARFKWAFLSAWESSEECTEEDDTPNSGDVPANNASDEEYNIVEDKDDEDLDADSEEVNSAIQACVARIFALLN